MRIWGWEELSSLPEVTHLISDRWTKGPGARLQSWGLGSGASGSRALAAESQSTRCACFRSGLCLATRAGTVVSAEPVLPVSGVSFSFFPLRQHLASQTFGGHSCRASCCETDNKGGPRPRAGSAGRQGALLPSTLMTAQPLVPRAPSLFLANHVGAS